MNLAEALSRIDKRVVVERATLEVPSGWVRVGSTQLLATTTMSLDVWSDSRYGRVLYGKNGVVHLIDPRGSAEVGAVNLYPLPLATGDTPDVVAELEEKVDGNDVVSGYITMAYRMGRLGFRADWSSYDKVDLRTPYGYVDSFVAPHSFKYGDRARICVCHLDYRLVRGQDGRRVGALRSAAIYAYTPCCDGTGSDLYSIAVDALRPWGQAVEVKARPDGQGASALGTMTFGFGFMLYLEARTRGNAAFTVGDFLGNYVPEVARKIKDYVDAKTGQTLAITT